MYIEPLSWKELAAPESLHLWFSSVCALPLFFFYSCNLETKHLKQVQYSKNSQKRSLSNMPRMVLGGICHIWYSAGSATFGTRRDLPHLVLGGICHIWYSAGSATFGTRRDLPHLVLGGICHIWYSAGFATYGTRRDLVAFWYSAGIGKWYLRLLSLQSLQ